MTHIAIIGAGIIGAVAADQLTQAGARVTLIDTHPPGTGTSATSLAWLNSNRKHPRTYHDFSVQAMREWRQLAATFIQPTWYAPTGNLTWATTSEQRAELTSRIARLRDWDYPAGEISMARAGELEPRLRIPPDAAIAYFPGEGFIHTHDAVRALTGRAQEAGAQLVITGEPVTLETDGTRVTAVTLPYGNSIHADIYVCCAGWRTPHLLEPLGITIPMIRGDQAGSTAPCLVTRITTHNTPIRRVIQAPQLKLRPTAPGGLHLEATDINALVDWHTERDELDRHAQDLITRAIHLIPALLASEATNTRLCVRPLPADGRPIVGWLPRLTNAYLIITHSGVTLAPLLARLAAAELLQDATQELEPYRLTRFSQQSA